MSELNKNSSMAIAQDVSKKLNVFCKANNITKKDFVDISLEYFKKNGVNPLLHDEPKKEIEKLIKRQDQLFAFVKAQEHKIIIPYLENFINKTSAIADDLEKIKDVLTKIYIEQKKISSNN